MTWPPHDAHIARVAHELLGDHARLINARDATLPPFVSGQPIPLHLLTVPTDAYVDDIDNGGPPIVTLPFGDEGLAPGAAPGDAAAPVAAPADAGTTSPAPASSASTGSRFVASAVALMAATALL